MKRLQLISVLAIVFALFRPAAACSVYAFPSVCDAYGSAEAIFVGTVRKIEEVKNLETFKMTDSSTQKEEIVSLDGSKYYIKVEKTYKGAPQTEITLVNANDSCRIYRKAGDKLLLYVRFDEKLQMWKFSTHRNAVFELADEDLLFLEGLPKTLNRTRVSGRLLNTDTKADFPFMGMSGIKLKFQGQDKTFEATTGKNGVYEIYDLPLGAYTIIPEVPEGLITERPSYQSLGRIVRKLPTREDENFGWVDLRDTGCIGVNFLFKSKATEPERK